MVVLVKLWPFGEYTDEKGIMKTFSDNFNPPISYFVYVNRYPKVSL